MRDLMLTQRSQRADAFFQRAKCGDADPQHDEHEDDEQGHLPLNGEEGLRVDQVMADRVEAVGEGQGQRDGQQEFRQRIDGEVRA